MFRSLMLPSAIVLFTVPPALAAPVLTFDELSGTSGANSNQSVGWQFDVVTPITVDALGWYDEGRDGLQTSHTVGMWDGAGTLLASVFIPMGTSGELEGQFRSIPISPLTLNPGTGYIVGGQNFFTNNERLASNVAFTINPSISFVDATFGILNGGFERPTFFSSAQNGFFGPSFSVSTTEVVEPSTILLLGAGGLAFASKWRWGRKQNSTV